MCKPLHKVFARALLMSAAMMAAGFTAAATQDDELTIDPTMPLQFSAGAEAGGLFEFEGLGLANIFTSYELSSVLIRAEDRIAVINGERVRVGDQLGAAVVTGIEADHVTLSVNGEVQTLMLYEDSIKTLVKGDE